MQVFCHVYIHVRSYSVLNFAAIARYNNAIIIVSTYSNTVIVSRSALIILLSDLHDI